jgi:MscS family membrane protein
MKDEVMATERSWVGRPSRWGGAAWGFFFVAVIALGQEPANPLKPLDRSSPRAALKTFLDSGDALGSFLVQEYLPSPTRAEYHRMGSHVDQFTQGLDLSHVPPAARIKTGRAAAIALYEILSRIPLPPFAEIPDAEPFGGSDSTNIAHWVIPNTEIALVRQPDGPCRGEFLFSAETVAKADDYYSRVQKLAYARPVPLENFHDIMVYGGGWMVPHSWIKGMPAWLRGSLAGQAAWKWIALVLILGVFVVLMGLAFRLSRCGNSEHRFRQALAQLAFPAFLLLAIPALAGLLLVQVNLLDQVGSAVELAATAIMYVAGAWIAWRASLVVAETIIASPRIAPEGIDAHLTLICSRLLGLLGAAWVLALGADQLGVPVYGIIAGLGVGGLALALAAQPTIENLIGGLSLFADKPIQIGDLCRCGDNEGTIEAIGIRSTRIRGLDRTLTTIPNAELSKMAIVNYGRRDRILIHSVIGVRYETSQDQMRYLLVQIREMLLAHPHIHPDLARVRFVGFGTSSLDIEIFAYAATRNKTEFLRIREEIWLRVMDLIEQSGTGFAFPSQTLYMACDNGLDATRTRAAEAQARQWRDDARLPFPEGAPAEAATKNRRETESP